MNNGNSHYNFVFVAPPQRTRPAYAVDRCGTLYRYTERYDVEPRAIPITAREALKLLENPLTKSNLLDRCDRLYVQIKHRRKSPVLNTREERTLAERISIAFLSFNKDRL